MKNCTLGEVGNALAMNWRENCNYSMILASKGDINFDFGIIVRIGAGVEGP